MATKHNSILKTNKRVRLGIWGLGRGMSFYKTCQHLNIDVVAGCDFNLHMRERFKRDQPDAFVSADADEFLAQDFDAVLLATFCPSHGPDAIRCLKAGKHVLSEVTSFHTMAEGVELVEAVEKSGLVYNLAENYPFSAANMYLARKWKEGLFGDLMYGEYEYVHEILSLAFTYIDGVPIKPGHHLHNWRSWINFHYYNTHSLGPMMVITDTRPTRVTALLGTQRLPGFPLDDGEGLGCIAPSLINMDNGSVVRNLMGSTTNDVHQSRLWGTKGSAEIIDGKLRLRLGGSGWCPKHEVKPTWDDLGELAAQTGHGGGDFWVLYYFVRQILFGEPGPFEIYAAADCTIPGILAYRSSREGGTPYDVPDFRKKKDRDKWRNDHYACPRFDVDNGAFPKKADPAITDNYTTVMGQLIRHTAQYRAYREWSTVEETMVEPIKLVDMADYIIKNHPAMVETYKAARKIINAYPKSEGARFMREVLDTGDEKRVLGKTFLGDVKKHRTKVKRVYG